MACGSVHVRAEIPPTTFLGVDVEVGEPSRVGRISAISVDGMRMWIQLTEGEIATVDSHGEPFEATVGTVLLVRSTDNHLELAPDDVWPDAEAGQARIEGLWVGVVKLRHD